MGVDGKEITIICISHGQGEYVRLSVSSEDLPPSVNVKT